MLRRKEEWDTYLTHVSAPAMSTDVSQVDVTLFPSFCNLIISYVTCELDVLVHSHQTDVMPLVDRTRHILGVNDNLFYSKILRWKSTGLLATDEILVTVWV